MKNIAILFGGCSTEHNISLESSYSVIQHINREKYNPILIGITKTGCWYLYEGAIDKIPNGNWETDKHCTPAIIVPDRSIHGMFLFRHSNSVETLELDAAFPILHGKNGEDGTIQGLLELAGIPIIGCHTLSSALGMDKALAHLVAASCGIQVPSSIVLQKGISSQKQIEMTAHLTYPLFVKPVRAGSSFGISKVTDTFCLQNAIKAAFEYDTKVIIEEEIKGFEVGCAILEKNLSGEKTFLLGEIDEIELSHGFFNYTEKYTLASSTIHMPARITQEMSKRLKQTALTIYHALECSGFARIDMFVTPSGEIVFNEVNTIPGFTSHSRYPNMLKGIGLTFEEIVNTIIESCLLS